MTSENTTPQENKLEASFSTLILSIASSAAMSLGLAPNPTNNKTEKNLEMARFNIDLLVVLQDKTKNNLDKDEGAFLESVIRDLQLKFIQHQ
ncbi:MAG: DUF1844 domain-containing protein [Bdellovibrionaceae bacterium]|nr:DUF1844 domain-containing protein [Bdellovibrionales bacterium]MCB9084400.1 DUF1844 domain-containing protein [Pseudobdellovibrionaceae bacterium]